MLCFCRERSRGRGRRRRKRKRKRWDVVQRRKGKGRKARRVRDVTVHGLTQYPGNLSDVGGGIEVQPPSGSSQAWPTQAPDSYLARGEGRGEESLRYGSQAGEETTQYFLPGRLKDTAGTKLQQGGEQRLWRPSLALQSYVLRITES